MTRKLLITILIVMSLAGCSTMKPLSATTGKPEVIITEASKKDIADAIINAMLTWDYQLQKQDEDILIFGKKIRDLQSDPRYNMFHRSQYDIVPELRLTYSMVDYADGNRIIVSIEVVRNPGSGYERTADISKGSKEAQKCHEFLENLKNNFKIKQTLKK